MLKKAALEVVDAVKLGNDEGARQGVGKISKSCADCHDKYR
jgi:cytochrome c556